MAVTGYINKRAITASTKEAFGKTGVTGRGVRIRQTSFGISAWSWMVTFKDSLVDSKAFSLGLSEAVGSCVLGVLAVACFNPV